MTTPVLICEELRTLLDPADLEGWNVTWLPADRPVPAGSFAAFVSLLTRRVDDAVLESMPSLRIVANCAVGYDNVDLAAAARRGILVTNTPGVLTQASADLTWALILAAARGLPQAEATLRAGEWKGWHPAEFLGLELEGATLGIVGAGRIGQAVARRALGFQMRILYASRTRKPEFEKATGARHMVLDDLLEGSDVVTLHAPSREDTRGMMDGARFARMRPGSIFINTSRGDLVDEEALVDALERGHLGAAGLDVYRNEPRVNPRLIKAPHLVLLPHIASATTVTRRAMARTAVHNARAVLRGHPPLNPVPEAHIRTPDRR